jgi:hypothetical protein
MFNKSSILFSIIIGISTLGCSSESSGFSGGAGDADSDTDTDSDTDSDADADADSDSDADTGPEPDAGDDTDADSDTDVDADGGPDGDADGDADTDADGGDAWCAGAAVGDSCWYFGAPDASCEDACAEHGGFDIATQDYAGSDGTDANCTEVLESLGATGGTVLPLYDSGTGVGCMTYFGSRYRVSDPATTADATYVGAQRACACLE